MSLVWRWPRESISLERASSPPSAAAGLGNYDYGVERLEIDTKNSSSIPARGAEQTTETFTSRLWDLFANPVQVWFFPSLVVSQFNNPQTNSQNLSPSRVPSSFATFPT